MKKIIAISALIISLVVVICMFQPVRIVEVSGSVSILPIGGSSSGLHINQGTEMPVSVDRHASYEIKLAPWISYAMTHGKPKISESKPQELGVGVVDLTIKFTLVTPTKNISFEPLKLGKGGVHNFTLVLGPDEGISTGKFKLVIEFYLKVETPAGITIGPIVLTPIVLEFEITE